MTLDAVLERVEQMAELGIDLLATQAEDLEDPFLQLSVVDPDASTRDLKPIEDAVISASADFIRP